MKPKLITKLGRERMQRMIAYLRELPPERFDYNTIAKDECGSVGCVIGHTPHIFPEFAKYKRCDEGIRVEVDGLTSYVKAGAIIFGLNEYVSEDLFTAGAHFIRRLKLPVCDPNATPTEVADMLESFLSQVDDIEEPARPA